MIPMFIQGCKTYRSLETLINTREIEIIVPQDEVSYDTHIVLVQMNYDLEHDIIKIYLQKEVCTYDTYIGTVEDDF